MLAMSPRASFAPHATIAAAVNLRSAGVNREICQLMPRRNVPRGTFGVRAWSSITAKRVSTFATLPSSAFSSPVIFQAPFFTVPSIGIVAVFPPSSAPLTGRSITSPEKPVTFSVPRAAMRSCDTLRITRTGRSPFPSRTMWSGLPVSASTRRASALDVVNVPRSDVKPIFHGLPSHFARWMPRMWSW